VDTGVIIAEVARRTGTLLDRNDPVLIVSTVADIVAEAHHAETRAGIADLRAVISSAQPRFDADSMRALGQVVRHDLLNLARTVRLGVLAGIVLAILVTHVAAFGAGYWFHGNQQLVAGVSAGQQECQEQAGGGTLCRIPVWAKLPPR
jgi:hypothetical protein